MNTTTIHSPYSSQEIENLVDDLSRRKETAAPLFQLFKFGYFSVFNKDMRIIICNDYALQHFVDDSLTTDSLIGKKIDFFDPVFKKPEVFYDLVKCSEKNKVFELNKHTIDLSQYKNTLYLNLYLYKYSDITLVTGNDIDSFSQKDVPEQETGKPPLCVECDKIRNQLMEFENKLEAYNNNVNRCFYKDVETSVVPLINILKQSDLDHHQRAVLNILETNLDRILGPALRSSHDGYKQLGLTSRESKIADFVKEGMSTKDISKVLNISTKTIDFYRNNIRKKLHITNTKRSLQSYLLDYT